MEDYYSPPFAKTGRKGGPPALSKRIGDDTDCLKWFALSIRGRFVTDKNARDSFLDLIGVAGGGIYSADIANNKISAWAAGSAGGQWQLIINALGGFFTGGDLPGIPDMKASSESGRILILLHELAHLAGIPGFEGEGTGPDSVFKEAWNNALILQHCEKTITGK